MTNILVSGRILQYNSSVGVASVYVPMPVFQAFPTEYALFQKERAYGHKGRAVMKKHIYGVGALVLLLFSGALFLFSPSVPPEAPHPRQILSGERSELDQALLDQGVVEVRYTGREDRKLKVQITQPDGSDYNYDLNNAGNWETYPLTLGNGTYTVKLLEHIEGERYAIRDAYPLELTLADPLSPVRRPHQIVSYTPGGPAAARAGPVAARGENDLARVELLFDYVVDHVSYDYGKSAAVAPGYLPDVEKTLAEGKGICFDYAALLCAMVRSQGIPCRLVTGNAIDGGTQLYHAWVEVWCQTGGTVDGVIPVTAEAWSRLDPTFVSSGERSRDILDFVSDDENYEPMFYY